MPLRATPPALRAILLLLVIFPYSSSGQQPITLTATVTDSNGKPVTAARVSVKNAETGQTAEATMTANGIYKFPELAPGSYTVFISAEGFSSNTSKVTLAGSGAQTLNFTLTPAGALPNAPNLGDLGFTEQQTQANPKLQARLDRRTEMLKIHQKLGLITLAPMAADLITGPMAKAKGRNGQSITEPTQTNLDLHAALGSTTVALYSATAYFAIFAPKIPGVRKRGAIRLHEALAFVHGPGMILTPILGGMAFKQEQDGEKVHGIASAHGAVATATVLAYGASIIAVSWPIHLKFWEK